MHAATGGLEVRVGRDRSPREIARFFALSAFLTLFPGMFVMRGLSAGQQATTLAALYLPVMTVLHFVWGLAAYLATRAWSRFPPLSLHLGFFFLMAGALIVATIEYLIVPRFDAYRLLSLSGFGTVGSVTFFFLCLNWRMSDPVYRYAAVIAAVALSLAVLTFTERGLFLSEIVQGRDDDPSYQLIARVTAMTGLFAIAVVRQWIARAAIAWLVLIALFHNGARTEFVLFITGAGVILLATAIRSVIVMYFSVFMLIFAVTLMQIDPNAVANTLPESRILELLYLDQSASWASRHMAQDFALETIWANPVWGDYGSYYERFGMGFYSHNLLSAWVDLGLFGFLGYVVLTAIPFVWALTRGLGHSDLPEVRLAIGTAIYTGVGYVFSHFYLSAHIGLSLASYLVARNAIARKKATTFYSIISEGPLTAAGTSERPGTPLDPAPAIG